MRAQDFTGRGVRSQPRAGRHRPPLAWCARLAAVAGTMLLSSCGAPVMLAGPAVQAVSAGAGAYSNGEIQAAWTVPIDTLFPAALDALQSLELELVNQRLFSGKRGLIFAEDLSGRSIEVAMKAISPAVTRFTIRVGTFGDEAVSRLIVRQLEIELGERTESPIVPEDPGAGPA